MLYLLKPEILAGYVKRFEITCLWYCCFLSSDQSVQATVTLLASTSTTGSFPLP